MKIIINLFLIHIRHEVDLTLMLPNKSVVFEAMATTILEAYVFKLKTIVLTWFVKDW